MPDIKIPSVGESISTALIAQWHIASGGSVAAGAPLLTLETDKVSTELTAEVSGVVTIGIEAGTEVAVGTIVGSIDPAAISATPAPAPTVPVPAPTAPSAEPQPVPTAAPAEKSPSPTPAPAPQVVEVKSAPTPAVTSSTEGRQTRKKMTPLRRKIAMALVEAQHSAAMLTTFNEADMSAIMQLRKELQDSFVAKHGLKLGFMSFFVKAVVDALKAVPALNSRIDGDSIIQNHFYDIGVAVSTEKGLIVPVIRDCDKKSFAEIESAIIDVATRARTGKIQLEELQGGVFTITNGGIFGSLLSTPILNAPQSGILGMHAIQERPIAKDGQVVIRPMMYLAMSYDHRVVDGREAVTFLVRIKECLENPSRLLLGA